MNIPLIALRIEVADGYDVVKEIKRALDLDPESGETVYAFKHRALQVLLAKLDARKTDAPTE